MFNFIIYSIIFFCILFWSLDAISLINGTLNKTNEYAVIKIIDGDGAVVLNRSNKKREIRLHGIDAPELGQQYGFSSKLALKKLIYRKIVKLEFTNTKSYDRDVVKLYLKNKDINKAMIEQGAAWVEPRYAKDKSYYTAQEKAKLNRIGLWHKNKPMPPWVWRRLFNYK